MTIKEAYKILGVTPETEWKEIKKRYRQLLMQIHPDSMIAPPEHCAYNVQELNIAYSFLKQVKNVNDKNSCQNGKFHDTKEQKYTAWDAPVNKNAYMEREILHYVEDYDGTVLGNFCIAKGKYLWKTEEDFSLFLLSIYQCGKLLLDEIDTEKGSDGPPVTRQRIQAELTYLLAQQFIDASSLLKELAKEENTDENGNRIFYIPSMLESSNAAAKLSEEEILYPSAIKRHKLYLKNRTGQELGYLSFHDDRLYYVIIPLFEQKKMQIKIQAAEKSRGKSAKASAGYQNLHLWIKIPKATANVMPENLNLQIEQLLSEYSRRLSC